MSLNSQLLAGPSLYTSLVQTLLGFRLHRIALIGDVCEMFLQVELATDDRKYHRVLWRNMKDEEPKVYEPSRWLFRKSGCSIRRAMRTKGQEARGCVPSGV